DVAKDVTEDVVDVGEAGTRAGPAPAHAVLEGGMAVLVVDAPLAAVGQHLVGLLGLLEARFRLGVARIAVGVVFLRGAPVGLLDLLFGGIAGHAQHFVVIALAHRVFPGSFTPLPAPGGKSLPPGRGQSPPHAVACGQATYLSLSLTSVNSASTTSSALPPAAAPAGCSAAGPWSAAAAAAYSDWAACCRAWVLASICALSSPFIAVSSSDSAVSIAASCSPGTLDPCSLMAVRVAWIRPSAALRAVTSSWNFLSSSRCASASATMRWISSSVRPEPALISTFCSLPVFLSLAETCRMPLASMSKDTSIC